MKEKLKQILGRVFGGTATSNQARTPVIETKILGTVATDPTLLSVLGHKKMRERENGVTT